MIVLRSMIFLLAATTLAAQGQAPLTVGYQKQIQVQIAGATAAYSLDSNIVEAVAAGGLVEIRGESPGTTNIIVVTQAGTQSIAVTVPQPAPVYPPGFEPPHAETGETGIYEFRYNSDPGQIVNSLEMKRTQGQNFERMQIVNANLFSASSTTSAVGFPFLSYELGRPRLDLTFLDQMVDHSPLTIDNYLVRGFHMRDGPWQFHGGFTSIATFQGLFLSTDREYTAGVSRLFQLDPANSFEANAYYFRNPTSLLLGASNGAVGSLVYRFKKKDRINFLSELGVSHGLAFASRGTYDDDRDHVTGNFRMESRNFASLAVNNQHGTFADLSASRKINPRLYASLDLNQADFNLPLLQQNTFTTSALLNFKINRNFSLTGGGAFSTFQSKSPAGDRISTMNLPAGIDYSARHFGAGFEYQRTINFDGTGGNDFATNARFSTGQFQLTGFYRHDVQVPTLSAIFSAIPGLEDALLRAGITATTPEQLADLLRNTALLESLGFTNLLTVNLAPSRNDFGATATWLARGTSRRRVDLSYFDSETQLLQGSLSLKTATLSYAQRLGMNNDLVGSAALVRTANNGVNDTHPLFTISLQHRFFSVPGMILPGRHGVIQGRVFRDDDATGSFSGQESLAGVEVVLDDTRVTRTDSHGSYFFHHVPFGVHRVEAKFHSDDPFFYTTDSPATADINSTVDFGINFARGQVFGFLLNDARAGVGAITIELRGEHTLRRMQTGEDGKFSFPGLPPGTYSISATPESFPPGYSLETLTAQQASVEPGRPISTQLTVTALRSISGRVVAYDKTVSQNVPVAGAVVRIKELGREAKTGENGAYIFRNLPAGTCSVAAEYGGREIMRVVVVPATPANIRDIELNAGSK